MTLGISLLPNGIENVALFLSLGTLSVLLVSMAKAGFGGGVGLLSVPLMIYACGEQTQLATAIMLPILIANDYVAIAAWWRKWDLRAVLLLVPGLVIGVGIGWWAIWALRHAGGEGGEHHQKTADAALMLGIGIIALGFVALQVIRARRTKPLPFRPILWQGTAVGAVAGITSTLAHAAGPVVNMYMLPQQMSKERFVSTTLLYFWIGNQVKLIPYGALGMLNADSLGGAACFLPAVVAGTVLGVALNRKVGQRQFTGVVYVLLALTGVHLVIGAVDKLWL